jgi:heme exporter protein D
MMDAFTGKYAMYIVPSYAAAVVVFAWLTLDSLLRTRAWRRKAEALQAQKDAKA